jgi:uncharacterized protein with GYD domain
LELTGSPGRLNVQEAVFLNIKERAGFSPFINPQWKESNSMPVFISQMKLTEQGKKEIMNAETWIQENYKCVEAMGGKIITHYNIFGEYDYLAISEFPNEEVATRFVMTLSSLGYIQMTNTLALPQDEFAGIESKFP